MVSSCARGAAPAPPSRIGAKPSAGISALHRHVADIADGEIELQSPVDEIVGAEPLQRPPHRLGREVAAARRHRARLHRRAEQGDRRVRIVGRAGRRSISSSSFAHTRARPLEGEPCGTACSSTATSPPWTRPSTAPFGAIENGAIGIQDGRIVRVGRRTELAGYQAKKVEPLHGAWVTPGLVDCHTHLVFGGNRAGEFEQRLEGATYEEIARAGGGIVSTVKATRAATLDELVEASRPRLRALMAGGVTTVEIKSGYGLDIETELKMLRAAKALGESETVRVERDPARAPRAAARIRGPARGVRRAGDRIDPAGRRRPGAGERGRRLLRGDRLHAATRSRALFEAARDHGLGDQAPRRAAHQPATAPRWPPIMARFRPTISNMLDEDGRRGDGARRHGRGAAARRLLCAARRRRSRRSTCCAATACRWRWRPTAIPAPRRCSRRP